MVRRLGHLCLVTDRLDMMLDFYNRRIGLPLKYTFKNRENQVFGYSFACGDSTYLEIFDRVLKTKLWGGALVPLNPSSQVDHFSLEVGNLEEFKAQLRGRGVAVGPIKKELDESLQVWVRDPDGNAIEFKEYPMEKWHVETPPAVNVPQ